MNQISAQAEREIYVYTGEKTTSMHCGRSANQKSKPWHLDESGMLNHWAIPMFSTLSYLM